MSISKFALDYHHKMFGHEDFMLLKSDPEFVEIFGNFAFDEVINTIDLDEKTRYIAILACLLGLQATDEYKIMVEVAYNMGLGFIEIKEIVYQAVAYLGMGRVYPFLTATNEFIIKKGGKLPLETQNDSNPDRKEKGEKKQIELFGPHMEGYYDRGDEGFSHINKWLVTNCFGDYYTRSGLNNNQREMITFCFLMAQGGCEPQLKSHASANISLGNDKDFLYKVISTCLPFMGYPRSLNAFRVVKEV